MKRARAERWASEAFQDGMRRAERIARERADELMFNAMSSMVGGTVVVVGADGAVVRGVAVHVEQEHGPGGLRSAEMRIMVQPL